MMLHHLSVHELLVYWYLFYKYDVMSLSSQGYSAIKVALGYAIIILCSNYDSKKRNKYTLTSMVQINEHFPFF